jgi:hypothetical protein
MTTLTTRRHIRRLLLIPIITVTVVCCSAGASASTDIRVWPLQTLIQTDNAPPVGVGAKNQQIPQGVPAGYDWQTKPVIHQAQDPNGYHYFAPWGQVYDAATGVPAPADRVEVRGLQEWVLSKATGQWSPLFQRDIGYAYGHTPVSSVTASSYQWCSKPASAIDGIKNGLPNPYPAQCNEWASGQGAGAWLKLSYGTAQDIRSVVLNDRPNLNDQVTAGNLTFDDGRVVNFGALDNSGAATTVQVPGGDVTHTVTINVTAVSSTTTSAGFEEVAPFAVYSPDISGALYPDDFAHGTTVCASLDRSTPGSVLTSPNVDCNGNPVTGHLYHLYANTSRVWVPDTADVAAVASMVQVRLAPSNQPGPDPDYVANMGADEWACASGCSTVDGMGESRMKTVTQDWNTFVFSTADPTTALPPLTVNGQPVPASELR